MTIVRRTSRVSALAALAAVTLMAGCGSSSKGSSTATAGTSATTSAAAGPSGSTINIGVTGAVTGPQSSSTTQLAVVAPAWEQYVNQQLHGINGHPVKVYVEDDGGDPAKAQANYQDLVNTKHVIAIVVGDDTLVSAFASNAISQGVALISGGSNNTDWYTKTGMFSTPTGVVPGVAAQVAVAKNFAHATKFADLYCAEIAACQQANPILQGAATKLGMGFSALAVNSTAPSYTAQCLQLQQQKVDYAQLNFASAAAVKFVQDCQAQGYNPTWGSSEQAAGPAFASLTKFTMFGPAYAFPSVATAAPVQTFVAAMKKYATSSNWREGTASFTWTGLEMLRTALANVGANPTRQEVFTGLYALKNEDLGGLLANKITWTQGKPEGFTWNPCYFVVGMKGGQTIAPAGLTPQCPAGS